MTAQEQLRDLLQRWIASTKTGKAMPLAELCRDCPEMLPEVENRVRQMIAEAKARKATEIPTASAMPVHEGTQLQQHSPSSQPTISDGYPTELGGYKLTRVLGEGGMGRVYLAEDARLSRKIAIKVMRPDVAGNPDNRERFLREARAAAALDHDHIITIHQVGEENQIPFLVMPLLKGEPLDERLKRDGQLPLKETLRIAREIAEGLATAHDQGLIHRDIKPANIWLEGARSRVKILDFGLARTLGNEHDLTHTGAVMGTPAYMAPEQAEGQRVDSRADLFSLGCVIYQIVSGKRPFEGNTMFAIMAALATHMPPPLVECVPGTPQSLSDLVDRLLAKRPEGRPSSTWDVVTELRKIEESLLTPTMTPSQSLPVIQPLNDPWSGIDNANATEIVEPKSGPADAVRQRVSEPSRNPTPDKVGSPSKPGSNRKLLMGGLGGFVLLLLGFIVIKITNKDGSVTELKVPEGTKIEVNGQTVVAEGPKKSVDPLPKTFKNSIGMGFVLVGKGTAWLGGEGGKQGEKKHEIEKDFYLGKYEVTQEEWEAVTGQNPSHFSRNGPGKDEVKDIKDEDLKRFPVEMVSWDDCQLFVERLNKREKEFGRVYRLPTEEEWEYACRGGPLSDKLDSAFDFYFAKPTNQLLPDQANFSPDGDGKGGLKRTCRVGTHQPNQLGLYDMHGNAWEWCGNLYTAEGATRAYRGGSWGDDAGRCRSAHRHTDAPSYRLYALGFRLALVPAAANGQPVVTEVPKKSVDPLASSGKLFMHDPAFPQWMKDVQAMPAEKQIEAVSKKLVELNPRFDGKLVKDRSNEPPVIENGSVLKLGFVTDNVTDISPVRALTGMYGLDCYRGPDGKGVLQDLSPLKGMKLEIFVCTDNPGLFDLSPLEGMPLEMLWFENTKVSDLSPLKGMPLSSLICNTQQIVDHSPLKNMPLKDLWLDFKPERDTEVLRGLKTLEKINGKPVAEFWKEFGKKKKK